MGMSNIQSLHRSLRNNDRIHALPNQCALSSSKSTQKVNPKTFQRNATARCFFLRGQHFSANQDVDRASCIRFRWIITIVARVSAKHAEVVASIAIVSISFQCILRVKSNTRFSIRCKSIYSVVQLVLNSRGSPVFRSADLEFEK